MKMYTAVHSVLLINRNVRPKEEMRRIKFSEVGCVITLLLYEAVWSPHAAGGGRCWMGKTKELVKRRESHNAFESC